MNEPGADEAVAHRFEDSHGDRATAEAHERVIAIDGPAGAGKSTIGRALAGRLGLDYLDTGAMYRAVTFAAMRRGILDDDVAVAALARDVPLDVGDHGVLVDGVDATTAIRGPEVTAAVSRVAANSSVRAELVRRQRAWCRVHGGGVIEGRDIGSVVFPDAELKLYLTASPRVRAERRVAEAGGDVEEIEAAIAARDGYDSSRAHSPLVQADGSRVVDTTGLGIEAVLAVIEGLLADRNGAAQTAARAEGETEAETAGEPGADAGASGIRMREGTA